MTPEDAARSTTALDDRPPMRGPGWSEFMDEPEPVDDSEDAISWHEVAGLLQVATIVALSIAAVFAVGAITGGVL